MADIFFCHIFLLNKIPVPIFQKIHVRNKTLDPFFCYFTQSQVFNLWLTLQQLIQPDLESQFIVRSQLGASIQSGSSPIAELQVVTKSTHLMKDCYAQLVSKPHHSKIRPPKQLGYRCMPLPPCIKGSLEQRRKVQTRLQGLFNF